MKVRYVMFRPGIRCFCSLDFLSTIAYHSHIWLIVEVRGSTGRQAVILDIQRLVCPFEHRDNTEAITVCPEREFRRVGANGLRKGREGFLGGRAKKCLF
jgi:hypothetical protein